MTKGAALTIGVVLTATALNLIVLANDFPRYLGVDFDVFARAVGPVTGLYSGGGYTPFIYPPTAILPFRAIAALPYPAFILLSAAAFLSAVPDKKVAGLSLLSHSAFKGLYLGQIPMLLAAGMFAALRLAPFAGGMIWGAIAAIKPQLMIFAPFALLVRRDWPMFWGMVAGAACSIALAVAAFGLAPWLEWKAAIAAFTEDKLLAGAAVKAITPAGIAAAWGYEPPPMLVIGGMVAAISVALAARHVEDEMLVGLIVAASLVASPYGYAHDMMAIIPACVVLMLRGRWAFAIPAAMIFVGTPLLAMSGLLWLLLMFAWQGVDGGRQAVPRVADAT